MDNLHILNRRPGHNPVTQIEDVPRPPLRRAQNLLHSPLQNLQRRKQRNRIEISLHRVAMAHRAPSLVQRLPPVQPNHVGACLSHLAQQPRRLHAKVDHRHAHRLHRAHQPLGRIKRVFAIIGQARANPPSCRRSGSRPRPPAPVDGSTPSAPSPSCPAACATQRVAVHHLLGVDVVLRSAALDHVAGQRVRRAAKADNPQPVAEVRRHLLDGPRHVSQVVGAIGAQRRTSSAVRTG